MTVSQPCHIANIDWVLEEAEKQLDNIISGKPKRPYAPGDVVLMECLPLVAQGLSSGIRIKILSIDENDECLVECINDHGKCKGCRIHLDYIYGGKVLDLEEYK